MPVTSKLSRDGFSLIELMMVSGLVALTSMATFSILSLNTRSSLQAASANDMSDIARQIMTDLREAPATACATGALVKVGGGAIATGNTQLDQVILPGQVSAFLQLNTNSQFGSSRLRVVDMRFRPHATLGATILKTNGTFDTYLYELAVDLQQLNAAAGSATPNITVRTRTITVEATFDNSSNTLSSCHFVGTSNDGRSYASLPVARTTTACGAQQYAITTNVANPAPTCTPLPRYNSPAATPLAVVSAFTPAGAVASTYTRPAPPTCFPYERVIVDGTPPGCDGFNGGWVGGSLTQNFNNVSGVLTVSCSTAITNWRPTSTMTIRCGQ